jgi:hypothetical protein
MDATEIWQPIVGAILGGIFTAATTEVLNRRTRDGGGKRSIVVAFVIGAALGGLVVWVLFNPRCPSGTAVRITSPRAGDPVPMRVDVKGNSEKLCSRHEIWMVVIAPNASKFYPQAGAAVVDDNGDWQSRAPALLGVEGETKDVGKSFRIRAVVADRKAQRAFDEYIDSSESKGSFDGLDRLPEGIVASDTVEVTLS